MKNKIHIHKMIYDEGFHIDEVLENGMVVRIFCSKNFKCKNSSGYIGWCEHKKQFRQAKSPEEFEIFNGDLTEIPIEYRTAILLYFHTNTD